MKMADENEIVVIELVTADRIMLSEQILAAMQARGHAAYNYRSLDLGFDLPTSWPAGIESELTMAQLVILARKLDLRIVINGLIMVPNKYCPDG